MSGAGDAPNKSGMTFPNVSRAFTHEKGPFPADREEALSKQRSGQRAYLPALPVHLPSQSNTSPYHWIEFLGFRIQWFSSGNMTRRDGTFRR